MIFVSFVFVMNYPELSTKAYTMCKQYIVCTWCTAVGFVCRSDLFTIEMFLPISNDEMSNPVQFQFNFTCSLILNNFGLNKERITRSGLEPVTSGLMCWHSTNWAIFSPMLVVSQFCQYFCLEVNKFGQSKCIQPL